MPLATSDGSSNDLKSGCLKKAALLTMAAGIISTALLILRVSINALYYPQIRG